MNYDELVADVENSLVSRHGIMLSNEELSLALGYPTIGAFRKAVQRKLIPSFVFSVPNRPGKHALTIDIARWLVDQRQKAIEEV